MYVHTYSYMRDYSYIHIRIHERRVRQDAALPPRINLYVPGPFDQVPTIRPFRQPCLCMWPRGKHLQDASLCSLFGIQSTSGWHFGTRPYGRRREGGRGVVASHVIQLPRPPSPAPTPVTHQGRGRNARGEGRRRRRCRGWLGFDDGRFDRCAGYGQLAIFDDTGHGGPVCTEGVLYVKY